MPEAIEREPLDSSQSGTMPPTASVRAVSQLKLFAPFSGVVWPLERIPDPVFAQKMVGDGLSIDPTDAVLIAPCDGEVIALHAAGHAVTFARRWRGSFDAHRDRYRDAERRRVLRRG